MASASSELGAKPEAAEAAVASSSSAVVVSDQAMIYRALKKSRKDRGCTAKERISKMPPCAAGKRSSIYRGVTRHRWTGRYEAHLWDKSTWNESQNKKGKQVYLGAYDDEEAAARAYDLAALKYWGPGTLINFPVNDYARDLEEMKNVSREEYLVSLRRKSTGFSRGISKYRGPSRLESSLGRCGGPEYYSSLYGEDPAVDSNFGGGFVDQKIDLTGYIKWWGTNKHRQVNSAMKSYDEVKHCSNDAINAELKSSEWTVRPTEPYQMPLLGVAREGRKCKGPALSILGILSHSAAYKNLQEKLLKRQEDDLCKDDDNENKNSINRIEYGKSLEKSMSNDGDEKQVVPAGITEALPQPRTMYPLTSLLNPPLLTNYSSIDPSMDPVLWTSLSGFPQSGEVTKTEAGSTCTLTQPREE
ncbi:hypothetical protein MLD38_007578 [Melastoma candidum]|uniref:Uncharacterized protein n=1 Tax=Melastoma candidum TaxID=119954 RepID=A0ACB9RVU9_9MYRT|nr:hypothetical protein MLD38_007578 [Melastoma candidum]